MSLFKSYTVFFRFFLLLTSLCLCNDALASDSKGSSSSKSDYIMEHVKDSHQWHFASIKNHHITLHLPIIVYQSGKGVSMFSSKRFWDHNHEPVSYKGYFMESDRILALDGGNVYDFSITKNVAAMFISMVIMLFVFIIASRNYYKLYLDNKEASGFLALLDILINFIRDDIARPNIGFLCDRFLPYLLTVFFFILINNIMGLLPGWANVTGNISVTFALSFFTFLITNVNGNKNYWKHIFTGMGVPKWLIPLMVPIEIIGLFIKPISLMIRLFANITAGHIILISIIGIVFVLKTSVVGFFTVPFGVFMFFLKLMVAFLQAYIFTLLSSIYFGAAVEDGH